MNRLNEIEARANAATEGPWEAGDRYHCQAADKCECRQGHGPLIDTYQHPEWGTMHVHRADEPWWHAGVLYRPAGGSPGDVCSDTKSADAEFIAHARTDVPDMAAALRAVLKLHVKARPITAAYGTQEGGDYCYSCAEEWPCPTVEAIRRHIGDDL